MKKYISLLTVLFLLLGIHAAPLEAFAVNGAALEKFVQALEQSDVGLSEKEDVLVEQLRQRIAVKSRVKPPVFGAPESTIAYDDVYVFEYTGARESVDALTYYRSLSTTAWAEPDSICRAQSLGDDYGDDMLGTTEALAYLNTAFSEVASVQVAVVDTGIDFDYFADYRQRLTDSGVNTCNSGTADSALDDNGHGSMVSEIILRSTGDNVHITGYKVLNHNGFGDDLGIAAAIKKAADDGAAIINLSLGGIKNDITLDAVDYAYEKGAIVVCAAGNESANAGKMAPACSEKALTIGALDKSGHKSDYSNFGKEVDFVAPGTDIYFAYKEKTASGTSFASPYVAAEIALLLGAAPGLNFEQVKKTLAGTCVSAEALNYQSGFFTCSQDCGVENKNGYPTEIFSTQASYKDYFGNGMPEIDTCLRQLNNEPAISIPEFLTAPGSYTDTELTLAFAPEAGTSIYYTLDESFPTKESTLYTEPIAMETLTSVRAVAYTASGSRSFVQSGTYLPFYHANPADFTLSQDGSAITAYTGTKANIIVPEQIAGYTPTHMVLTAPNVDLDGITLPESIKTCALEDTPIRTTPFLIDAPGLEEVTSAHNCFYRTAFVNLPRIRAFHCQSLFLRELTLPQAQEVTLVCANLQSATLPNLEVIRDDAFNKCYSLKELYAPRATTIGRRAFSACYRLQKAELPMVKQAEKNGNAHAFNNTYCLKELNLPALEHIDTSFFSGSGVKTLYAPALISTDSLPQNEVSYLADEPIPEKEHARIYLSSAFESCTATIERTKIVPVLLKKRYYRNLIDFYGTDGTFAQDFATQNGARFTALPLLVSEPENMGYPSADILQAEAVGYALTYQWYGTNGKDNRFGTPLRGENAATLHTQAYDFNYYYCEITHHDGALQSTIRTGESDNACYDVNDDGSVDIRDIALMLPFIGQPVTAQNTRCDVNYDGIIDIADISILTNSQIYGVEI